LSSWFVKRFLIVPQTRHTILEHQTGVYVAKALTFDIITEMYTSHTSLLESLFQRKLKQYHKIMAELLQKYVRGLYLSLIINGCRPCRSMNFQNADGEDFDDFDFAAMSD
jgi:hypothetical protein